MKRGISLRDLFAAAALLGYSARPQIYGTFEAQAKACYEAADAMIAMRNKGKL